MHTWHNNTHTTFDPYTLVVKKQSNHSCNSISYTYIRSQCTEAKSLHTCTCMYRLGMKQMPTLVIQTSLLQTNKCPPSGGLAPSATHNAQRMKVHCHKLHFQFDNCGGTLRGTFASHCCKRCFLRWWVWAFKSISVLLRQLSRQLKG